MPHDGRRWQPITDERAPAPAGAYSPAVRAGDLLFVSGQVPKDPATGAMVEGGIAAQTRRVLENLRLALAPAGATLDDVVAMTVYLADEEEWGAFNAEYAATLRAPYPTRTVVGARLRGGIRVEVSAIAYLGER